MDSSVIPTSDRVHTHNSYMSIYILEFQTLIQFTNVTFLNLLSFHYVIPKVFFFLLQKKKPSSFLLPPRFPFLYFLPLFPSFICSIFFFFFVHLIYSKRNCNEKEKTKTKTKMNSAKNHNQNNKKKKNRDLLGESRKIKQK